jgi:hypothetical protein
MIDTIGFSDLKYDNHSLNNYVREYIHQHYNKINGFVFLIPKLRINREIINTILFTINYFNLNYEDIILVFNKSTDNNFDEHYIKELQKIDEIRDVINVCLQNRKIIFIDCITKSTETKKAVLDLLLSNDYRIDVPSFLERFKTINNSNFLLKISSFQINLAIYEYFFMFLLLLICLIFFREPFVNISITVVLFLVCFAYKFLRLYRQSSSNRASII